MRFRLIAEHSPSHRITHEFEMEAIDSVLRELESFLRGCGYSPKGYLNFVVDEVEEDVYDGPIYDFDGPPLAPTMQDTSPTFVPFVPRFGTISESPIK